MNRRGRRRIDYRHSILGLVAGIAFLNGADQSVMAAVAAPAARELHIDDTHLGFLGSAFVIVYALAVIPFGAWADRGIRGRVMGIGVAIWSLATFAGGLAGSYVQLLLARSLVGIGEASYLPASSSLIGDFYAHAERARALAWVAAGLRAGIGVGLIGGAAVAARFGWRAAFFAAGLPGLVLAVLAFRLREPMRGAAEAVAPEMAITGEFDWRVYRELLRAPTLLAVIATVALGLFVTAGVGYWVPFYVQRHFGVGVGPAGAIAGFPLLVGGLAGTFGGGWLADRRSRSRASGAFEVTAVAFGVGSILVAIAFSAGGVPLFVGAYLLAVTCLAVYIPAMMSVAQSIVIPTRRATAVTLALLAGQLLGTALAPSAIGLVADSLHDLGRSLVLLTTTVSVLAGAAALTGIRTAAGDMRSMERQWRALVQSVNAPSRPVAS
ncbi:MAG: MFS transporter [Chloroflexota bacterium]